MLILAAVPDIQLLNLRRAAAARFTLARAGSWAEALSPIRARPVELAVVDPLLSGEPRTREIERLRVLFPSLPLVLYTTLTPRTAGVLLTLGQRGIEHVIIARYDDHPLRLREVLAEEEAHSASRQLLDQLADALAPLPRELRWGLEEALRSPAGVPTVGPGAADTAVPQAAALPAGDRVVTAQGSSAPKPPPKTVLIVDDEAPLRRVLERSLARHGYRVLAAGSGEDAYQLLATEAVDAVLLDIHLPMVSGLSLYLAMTNAQPRLAGRIALMTGDAEAEEVRTWPEHHRCPVIRKPFNLSEVTDWLRRVLQAREREAGNG